MRDEAGIPAHATMVRPPFVALQMCVASCCHCSFVSECILAVRGILDVVRPHWTLAV